MAESSVQRRLAAIVMADVVGYSRLMGVDESGTLSALRERRKSILEPTVKAHDGRIVKLMGDGVLIEFASAVNAVNAAAEIQVKFAGANQDLPEVRHIVLRIGINLGDVIGEGFDIFGDGVNIAARLEALADPGGVCISGKVLDEVRGKTDVTFDDLGERNLKNIAGSVRAFAMTSARQPMEPSPEVSAKPSIAVLPFDNMSGDAERVYFSDGITEDIITELSRFRSLFVIARNSSFQYRGKSIDVRRVAKELGVRYVVEGSVRTMANRIRITAQLIDAANGNHLWSERFDRDAAQLFDVQDEVTRTIVATLTGRVEDAEMRTAASRRTDSLQAYDCLLRGIKNLRGYGTDDNRLALDLFEKAVALDPRFALAQSYLGMALIVANGYHNAPDAIKERAITCALTAVRLEPGDGRCHQFLGQAYRFRDNLDMAIQHLERGAALNPSDANGIAQLGAMLSIYGRADEGINLLQQAIKLDPFHPDWYWLGLGTAYYATQRYDDALATNRKVAGDKRPWHRARVAACLARLGRMEEARAEATEVLRLKPEFRISVELPHYKNSADAENVREGMMMAGLPD